MTNKMQVFGLFNFTLSDVHVSGDVFAHHEDHLTVFTASDIQGVTGGTDQTSGECSLGHTIPI